MRTTAWCRLLVTVLVLAGCSAPESKAPESNDPNAVLVAKKDIPAGWWLSTDQMEQRIVTDPPKDAYKKSIDVVGVMVGTPIPAGEIITPRYIDLLGVEDLKIRTDKNGMVTVVYVTKKIAAEERFTAQNIAEKKIPAASVKLKAEGDCPVFRKDETVEWRAKTALEPGDMVRRADVQFLELPY